MPESIAITGFSGINNAQDAARLKGPSIGSPAPADCTEMVNVDITDTLSVARRTGTTKRYSGTPKDIWANADGTEIYFTEGGYLKRLLPGNTAVNIRALTSTEPMNYTQVNYLTVCSNGVDLFMVQNGVSMEFSATSKRFKESVQAGHCLAYFNRRLYIGVGNVLWYTDADDIQRLDERDDPMVFNGRIRMILPLESGMFVMADKVYWLAGLSPLEFTLRTAYAKTAVTGSGVVTDGFPLGVNGKVALFWAGGICEGREGGQVINHTADTITATQQERGAAVVRTTGTMTQYLVWI
jgi:hypothetical protein